MKKTVSILIAVVCLIGLIAVPASAEENLCDEFLLVEFFHGFCNSRNRADASPDEPILEEFIVKPGEQYKEEAIYQYAILMHYQDKNKYPLVEFNRDMPEHIIVPEKDFVQYSKLHFDTSDAHLKKIHNLKYQFTYGFGTQGVSLYNATNKTYNIFTANSELDIRIKVRDTSTRYLVGYTKNGNTYDLYLNKISEWYETEPTDKKAFVDYVKVLRIHDHRNDPDYDNRLGPAYREETDYYGITNDWMKYTISYDGKNIKFLSNVKVSGVPKRLITPDGVVEYPDSMVYIPPVEKPSKPQTTVSSTPSSNASSVVGSQTSDISSETVPQETVSQESQNEEISSVETVTQPQTTVSEKENKTENKKEAKSNVWIFVTIGGVLASVVAGAVWYFVFHKKK